MNEPNAPDAAAKVAVREHSFDGIQEFDNHLPRWWLWSFYLACIFSFFYWLYYHGFALGSTPLENLAAELERTRASSPETMFSDDELRAASQDAAVVASGKALFDVNCIACHAGNGGGTLGGVALPGPNLTDNAWIHGGSPVQILTTIWKGVPEKGMVTWGPVLGKDRVRSLVAYLLTMRNTNVDGGKPAEGAVYEGQ